MDQRGNVSSVLTSHLRSCRVRLATDNASRHRGMDFTVEKSSSSIDPDNAVRSFVRFRMSEDLHRLVTATSEQPRPLIFVAADLGALVARFYTQMYEL